ncbi:MAG: hypothetical protein KDD35_10855, partial [Bdellovibrionales bacterium]|nr:hypothetical protein [Bdellovibrionales bacterium]
ANRGNQTELVRVEKSYPVGGALKPLCILTAIGLGGSCWYYLVLPTTQQKAQFKMDAQQLVKNELDLGPTDITREKITRVGWYDEKSSVSQNIHEQ